MEVIDNFQFQRGQYEYQDAPDDDNVYSRAKRDFNS